MRFLFRLSFLFCFSAAVLMGQSPDAPLPFQLKLIGPNIWAAIDDAKGDAGEPTLDLWSVTTAWP